VAKAGSLAKGIPRALHFVRTLMKVGGGNGGEEGPDTGKMELFGEIWAQNERQMREALVFEPGYMNLVLRLVEAQVNNLRDAEKLGFNIVEKMDALSMARSSSSKPNLEAALAHDNLTRFAFTFFLSTFCRGHDLRQMGQWQVVLAQLLSSRDSAEWFLQLLMRNNENGLFVAFLFDCDMQAARDTVGFLASEALGCVLRAEKAAHEAATRKRQEDSPEAFELVLPGQPLAPQSEVVRIGAISIAATKLRMAEKSAGERDASSSLAKQPQQAGEGEPLLTDELMTSAASSAAGLGQAEGQRSLAARFVDFALSFLHLATLRRTTKRFSNAGEYLTCQPYFALLSGFLQHGGQAASKYLHSHNVLLRLLDQYLGNGSPFQDTTPEFPLNGQGSRWEWLPGVDLTSYCELLSRLVEFYTPLVAREDATVGSHGGAAQAGVSIDSKALGILGSDAFLQSFLSHADTRAKARSVCNIAGALTDSDKTVWTVCPPHSSYIYAKYCFSDFYFFASFLAKRQDSRSAETGHDRSQLPPAAALLPRNLPLDAYHRRFADGPNSQAIE
jgi:hypothetical protein